MKLFLCFSVVFLTSLGMVKVLTDRLRHLQYVQMLSVHFVSIYVLLLLHRKSAFALFSLLLSLMCMPCCFVQTTLLLESILHVNNMSGSSKDSRRVSFSVTAWRKP